MLPSRYYLLMPHRLTSQINFLNLALFKKRILLLNGDKVLYYIEGSVIMVMITKRWRKVLSNIFVDQSL